jgi:hypothetical protein
VRGGRGTVAQHRAALRAAEQARRKALRQSEEPEEETGALKSLVDEVAATVPEVSVANDPPLTGLSGDAPEAFDNVANYEIPQPTPLPAYLNGQYCRGGSCQFRVAAPLPTTPPPFTPPPVPIGGNQNSGREFCRGLGCIPMMGWPGDAALASFNLNCVHLFNDIGGGLLGNDGDRTIPQVYGSFEKRVCPKRVGILEVGACPVFSDTFVGALAPKIKSASVGTVGEVCGDTYLWILGFKQAEVDMKLTLAALPKGKSLLATDLNRFGTGGVGPTSPRGTKWREYAYRHGAQQAPPAMPEQLDSNGAALAGAFLQEKPSPLSTADAPTPKPLLPGADAPEDTPVGIPRYRQNLGGLKAQVDSSPMYQIAPGSPDGVVPPTEVDAKLFTYCSQQFSEIMMGFGQTAPQTVKLTKDWCTWQASISSWVGMKQEYGHPDWSHRTCTGMQNLLSFALRNELADDKTGLSAQQVCKKVFLAIGSVHRVDELVKNAWELSLRGKPSSGIPAKSDDEMQKLLKEAQDYSNAIFSKLRAQKSGYDGLNAKRMEVASFDPNSIKMSTPAAAPDLPDSEDINPMALLSLSVDRVKQSKQVGILVTEQLSSWGHAV